MAGGDDEPRAVVEQVDSLVVPRYAGFTTFARLPRIDDVEDHAVAVLGVPFDSGVTYRPGARFGPAHIRQATPTWTPGTPTSVPRTRSGHRSDGRRRRACSSRTA